MNKRSLGVAAVFLLGCAVGGASSQLVVPKASAQQASTLTKWEHLCIHSDSWDQFKGALKDAGENRFELATSDLPNYMACFKRPKL